MEDFPSDFVVDLSPTVDGYANHRLSICNVSVAENWVCQQNLLCRCRSFLFPVKSLYNLDEDESQGAIAINLLPLVSQSELGRVTDGMNNQSKRYFDT